jgi:hypothetical protein
MKKYLYLAAALIAASATTAGAQSRLNKSANGNAAAPATVYYSASAEPVVMFVAYTSDTNNGTLAFAYGETAFTQTATNVATSSVTNQISGTNGLSVGATLYLERNGVGYRNTILTWNQTTNAGPYGGTNVVLNSGGWGVAASVGDKIFLMSTPNEIRVGATTNYISGEIFAGRSGRPLEVKVTPALATNRISHIMVRHE